MKSIFFSIFLLISTLSFGQKFYAYGNLSSRTVGAGLSRNVTITLFNGGYKPYPDANYATTDITTGMVVWINCTRFPITAIVSTSPLVLTVADSMGTGGLDGLDLYGYRLAILEESRVSSYNIAAFSDIADGNAGTAAGLSPKDGACIQNYYGAQLALAVAGSAGVSTGDKGEIDVVSATDWRVDTNAIETINILDGTITNADLANMAAATLKGSVAGGVPADLSKAQAQGILSVDDLVTLSGVADGATNLGTMSQGTQYPDNLNIKVFADSTDAKLTRIGVIPTYTAGNGIGLTAFNYRLGGSYMLSHPSIFTASRKINLGGFNLIFGGNADSSMVTIDGNGRLHVGNTTGTGSTALFRAIKNTGGGAGDSYFGNMDDATSTMYFVRANVVRGGIATRNSQLTLFGGSSANDHFVINSSGLIAIGGTTPVRKVTIIDSSNPPLRLDKSTANGYWADMNVANAGLLNSYFQVVTNHNGTGNMFFGRDTSINETDFSTTMLYVGGLVKIIDTLDNTNESILTIPATYNLDDAVVYCECSTGSLTGDANDGCVFQPTSVNVQGATNYKFTVTNRIVTFKYSSFHAEWKIISGL